MMEFVIYLLALKLNNESFFLLGLLFPPKRKNLVVIDDAIQGPPCLSLHLPFLWLLSNFSNDDANQPSSVPVRFCQRCTADAEGDPNFDDVYVFMLGPWSSFRLCFRRHFGPLEELPTRPSQGAYHHLMLPPSRTITMSTTRDSTLGSAPFSKPATIPSRQQATRRPFRKKQKYDEAKNLEVNPYPRRGDNEEWNWVPEGNEKKGPCTR
uniref:Uncharacterized protein n=1 Tax=Panagrellus redivivus TaxID=6233 RepID=A0A7E4V8B7_PANRE